MGLYIMWSDKRLNISDCEGIVDPSGMEEIWVPKPYLWSLSSRYSPNQVTTKPDYLAASPSQGLHWWIELIFDVQCSFDFVYYPFDRQECGVKFSSSYLPEDMMEYSNLGLITDKNIFGIQHPLTYEVKYTVMTSKEDRVVITGTHNLSSCGFFINLDRKFSPAIINFFMPSSFIVIIAFCRYGSNQYLPNFAVLQLHNNCSFFIAPTTSIPGRMALQITSYLILTNMSTTALEFKSATFTAMDIWFYACRLFVGGAILELFLVLRKRSKPETTMVKIGAQQIPMSNQTEPTSEEQCAAFDRYAFIIFNAVFLLFCIVFFSVCFLLR